MLNEKQLEAVEFKDGPCLTLAGPGSGKTTVLVERISSLISCGVNPETILVITFTKEAAFEMKKRFCDKSYPNSYNVTFGTFHSVFYHILKSDKYRDYELIDENRKLGLILECAKLFPNLKFSMEMATFIQKEMSLFYNTGKVDFKDDNGLMSQEDFFSFFNALEERKKLHKVMDFDDILVLTRDLLISDAAVLRHWQERFSYVLIDEFQDINKVQYDIVKLLIKNHPCGGENVFAVGDDDQSIYGFRGASPRFMLDFPDEFCGTKTIVLDKNYRSSYEIVNKSKKLIDVNSDRFYKEFTANSSNNGRVEVLLFDNEKDEAEKIAKSIISESEKGTLKDTAILYRNRKNRDLLYALLKKHDIKIFTDDTRGDFKSSEICKDICAMLRIAIGDFKRKDILRIMNKPDRSLSRGGLFREDVTLEKWRDFYPKGTKAYETIDDLMGNISIMKGLSPFSFINYFRVGLMYDKYLKDLSGENKEEYMEYFRIFDMILSYSKEFSDKRSLLKDLSEIRQEKAAKKNGEIITFYTFHGSKGLEFTNVYILDCVEGVTPSKNAKKGELIEEERRMFYVAMTRAKENLFLCVPKKITNESVNPSRFVFECGLDVI